MVVDDAVVDDALLTKTLPPFKVIADGEVLQRELQGLRLAKYVYRGYQNFSATADRRSYKLLASLVH